MSWTYDVTTARGQARLLCNDNDTTNQIFQDAEIDFFLTLENQIIKAAAALALETMASNEAYISKAIKMPNMETNGPAVAAALMKRAQMLRDQVDKEDYSFDIAEFTNSAFAARERIWDDFQRTSGT